MADRKRIFGTSLPADLQNPPRPFGHPSAGGDLIQFLIPSTGGVREARVGPTTEKLILVPLELSRMFLTFSRVISLSV